MQFANQKSISLLIHPSHQVLIAELIADLIQSIRHFWLWDLTQCLASTPLQGHQNRNKEDSNYGANNSQTNSKRVPEFNSGIYLSKWCKSWFLILFNTFLSELKAIQRHSIHSVLVHRQMARKKTQNLCLPLCRSRLWCHLNNNRM